MQGAAILWDPNFSALQSLPAKAALWVVPLNPSAVPREL
jgi:hypothetical protein